MKLSELEALVQNLKAGVRSDNRDPEVSFWLSHMVEQQVRAPQRGIFIEVVPASRFGWEDTIQHMTGKGNYSLPLSLV